MQRCPASAATLFLAVLGMALQPGPLAAQTTIYPVVITSQEGMEKQMAVLHGSARAAIEASVDYGLGGGDTVMYGIPGNSQDFLSQAQSLFDTAKAEYENLELDGAIEKLNLAMGKLEGGAAYLTDLSLATDILYYLGVCHSFNGDEALSSEAFLRAYVLAPDKKPDPDVFPPDVIDMFNLAVANVHGIGTGSLSVNSEPGAAQIYLDGNFMGLTPVTIDTFPRTTRPRSSPLPMDFPSSSSRASPWPPRAWVPSARRSASASCSSSGSPPGTPRTSPPRSSSTTACARQ
jgi:hypothetical protein